MRKNSYIVLLSTVLFIGWFISASKTAITFDRSGDIARRWIVCQYTLNNINPYGIALAVLRSHFPEKHSRDINLSAIPKQVPEEIQESIIPEFGPPEATYPPPGEFLMAMSIGKLPHYKHSIYLQLFANLLLLLPIVVMLNKAFIHPKINIERNPLSIILLLISFTPVYTTITHSQFSLLIFACLLYGMLYAKNDWKAALALTIALIKPTFSVPFLILLIVQKKWLRLAITFSIQMVLLGLMVIQVHTNPLQLVREWMEVGSFFAIGMYNVPELLNKFGLIGTKLAGLTPWILLVFSWLFIFYSRRSLIEKFSFLGIFSVLWTYHGPYDYVSLIPALLLVLGWNPTVLENSNPSNNLSRVLPILGFVCFIILSAALYPSIYEDSKNLLPRVIRWLGRGSIGFVFIYITLRNIGKNQESPTLLNVNSALKTK